MENNDSILPVVATIVVASLIVVSMVAFIIWAAVRKRRAGRTTTPAPAPPPTHSGGHDHGGEHHSSSHSEAKKGFWGHLWRILGTLFVLWFAFGVTMCGYRLYNYTNGPAVPRKAPEYPYSGTGRGTKMDGVKAYLDPRKAYTRISAKAKFVYVPNTSITYTDENPGVINKSKKWWDMPPGEYLVYPLEDEYLDFTWWHKDS